MEEEQLTKEWMKYDGDYCKAMQDIKTKDGKEYLMCWPNAGVWCVMSDNKQKDIPNDQVTHVRATHHQNW